MCQAKAIPVLAGFLDALAWHINLRLRGPYKISFASE
jgi:hypothetical protein